MNGFFNRQVVGRLAMRASMVIALVCALTLQANAADLLPTMSNVWVSATALGLTLISAASGPKK